MRKTPEDIKIDRISFQLGMINCFVEMVACGVKKLALSPPLSPEDYRLIGKFSEEIVKNFGIQAYLEKSLLVTDLQSEEFTRGKWLILYYEKDDILKSYLSLKKRKRLLEKSGRHGKDARKDISREFGRLLSYPEDKIEERISKDTPPTPFMITKD
jgi:hypothetical protein